MTQLEQSICTAFEGYRLIASGSLEQVAVKTKAIVDRGVKAPVLIFDDNTSEPIELDLRGTIDDVLARLPQKPAAPTTDESLPREATEGQRGPGRPKLGVVPREVTLLPRHWAWLNEQPGGASVALRKLVEEARRVNEPKDRIRRSQNSAYKFLTAMAGNMSGFEEATRALFAGNRKRFDEEIAPWPKDIRDHVHRLAKEALDPNS